VQSLSVLLSEPLLSGKLTPLEKLSAIVAAAIHDYDHPGVSNGFLMKTRDPLAALYNDQSPLENHHLSAGSKTTLLSLSISPSSPSSSFSSSSSSPLCAFNLSPPTCSLSGLGVVFQEDCNIFSHLTRENQDYARKLMIDLVLATDIARHFTLLASFNAKVNVGNLNLNKPEDLCLMLQMLMKFADISNPGKP